MPSGRRPQPGNASSAITRSCPLLGLRPDLEPSRTNRPPLPAASRCRRPLTTSRPIQGVVDDADAALHLEADRRREQLLGHRRSRPLVHDSRRLRLHARSGVRAAEDVRRREDRVLLGGPAGGQLRRQRFADRSRYGAARRSAGCERRELPEAVDSADLALAAKRHGDRREPADVPVDAGRRSAQLQAPGLDRPELRHAARQRRHRVDRIREHHDVSRAVDALLARAGERRGYDSADLVEHRDVQAGPADAAAPGAANAQRRPHPSLAVGAGHRSDGIRRAMSSTRVDPCTTIRTFRLRRWCRPRSPVRASTHGRSGPTSPAEL